MVSIFQVHLQEIRTHATIPHRTFHFRIANREKFLTCLWAGGAHNLNMLQWLAYRLFIVLCCFCNKKAKVLENTVLKDRTLSTAESDSSLTCLTQPPYPQQLRIRRSSSPPTTKPRRHQRPGFQIPDCNMYQVGVSPQSGRGCTSTELGTDMSIAGSISSVGFTTGRA